MAKYHIFTAKDLMEQHTDYYDDEKKEKEREHKQTLIN